MNDRQGDEKFEKPFNFKSNNCSHGHKILKRGKWLRCSWRCTWSGREVVK